MHFDVGVIGAGPAGLSAAFGLKANGVNVAVFEKYLWGGTCPNYGCDPKKFLVSATDALRHTQLLQGKGITGNLKVDWPTLMKRKEGYTSLTPEKTLNGLKSSGIPSFSGLATFIDENTIELPDGQQIHADKWILAMGQMPRKVQFSGSNFALSSEDFLKMPEMPEDITFIGAGYIAVEFASLANLAGSQVRLIIRGDKALRGFDEELTTELMEEFKQRGIELLYESSVESLSQQNGKILVKLTNEKEFLTDKVFAATGRVANIQGMNLEKAGVQYDENGILVDDKLMTSNPTIFAIGDVAKAGVPKLTPVGAYQGRYIARFISENLDEPITYPVIPTTVFASP
ncbi:MAG: NAD(P)/FAD-dependent oxidoreductase, partial [Streptococcaceae bacterium]|nr:NAD(P)/FAD-dependent oxidoreductase [Streptococcaceae bacterium]